MHRCVRRSSTFLDIPLSLCNHLSKETDYVPLERRPHAAWALEVIREGIVAGCPCRLVSHLLSILYTSLVEDSGEHLDRLLRTCLTAMSTPHNQENATATHRHVQGEG